MFCFVLQVLEYEDVYTNRYYIKLSTQGLGCLLFTFDSTAPNIVPSTYRGTIHS